MLWEHIQVCSESLPGCVRVTHEKVCIYTHLYVCCFEDKKKVCCSNTSYLRVHLCICGHLLEPWWSSSIWVAFFYLCWINFPSILSFQFLVLSSEILPMNKKFFFSDEETIFRDTFFSWRLAKFALWRSQKSLRKHKDLESRTKLT